MPDPEPTTNIPPAAPSPEGEPPPAPVVVDPAAIASTPPAASPAIEDEPTAAFTPEQMPYIEKLRRENAERRTRAKAWEDSFSAFDSTDQEWIQETFRLAASSDPAVAAAGVQRIDQMKAILLGQDPNTPATPATSAAPATPPPGDPAPVTNPDDAPLTQAQFRKWQEEMRQQQIVDSQKVAIDNELKSLGIQKYSDDQASLTPEYRMVINFARDDTNGDLKEAVAMLGRYQQAIRDQAVGVKADQAGRFPTTPGNAAGQAPADPATQARPSWEDARAKLESMLDATPGEAV